VTLLSLSRPWAAGMQCTYHLPAQQGQRVWALRGQGLASQLLPKPGTKLLLATETCNEVCRAVGGRTGTWMEGLQVRVEGVQLSTAPCSAWITTCFVRWQLAHWQPTQLADMWKGALQSSVHMYSWSTHSLLCRR
jgi:hypothetical protein